MRAGRAGRFRNAGCQIEWPGIEHGKLPIEQIDQLRAVLNIRNNRANAVASIDPAEYVGRAVCQGHFIIFRRGEQPGNGGADLSRTDHDDVLHEPSLG